MPDGHEHHEARWSGLAIFEDLINPYRKRKQTPGSSERSADAGPS